jgi:hypothetical protein
MNGQTLSNQLVIKNNPWGNWLISAMLIIVAVTTFFIGNQFIMAFIFLVIALVILAVGQSTSIVADRFQRTVSITKRSLFGKKELVIPFNEVANFEVEMSRTHTTSRNRTVNYRVVLIKTSGEHVPLQDIFTSNYNGKARDAKALSEYLNLAGAEDKPTNLFQMAMQSQAVMTTNSSMAKEGTTSGVAWKIEMHSVGGKPVTRWISDSYTCPGNFLLVSQKPANSSSLGIGSGGILGNLFTMVYQQILGMYGFLPSDTPGINTASAVSTQDQRFDGSFATLTNEQGFGLSLLNNWTLTPFIQWALRHPLKTVSTNDQIGQLAVLYSPRGVQVALLGLLPETEFDEIIALGVELVKAQGGGKIQPS